MPSPAPISNLTNPHDESFRDHLSDEAEDSLLERWTKLGEAVLAHGVTTEAHIGEMTALARSDRIRSNGSSGELQRFSGTANRSIRVLGRMPPMCSGAWIVQDYRSCSELDVCDWHGGLPFGHSDHGVSTV